MVKWYHLHIKNEILFWFLIVSLFPILTLFSLNYFLQKKQFETQAITQLEIILNEKISLLENQINYLESEIKIISSMPDVIQSFSESNQAFLQNNKNAINNPKLDDMIKIFLDKNRYYDLFFINNDGDIIYTLKKEVDLGTNVLHGSYRESNLALVYQKAKMLLETNISPFAYYPPSDEHAAFIAHPLYDGGKIKGVIAIQLSQATIFEIFSDAKGLRTTGELLAVGKNKQNKILSMTPLKYQENSVVNEYEFPSQPYLPAYKAIHGESGGGISRDYRGIEVISTWGYIPALDWGVVAKIDKQEVLQPIRAIEFYSLIVLFFVLLAIVIAILMATKHIVAPIDQLTRRVKEFSQGASESTHILPVSVNVSNEIGALANNFNEMAHNIKNSQETIQKYATELEEKISERTQELLDTKMVLEEQNISMQTYLDIIDKHVISSSTNLAGTIIDVSSAFCKITGYTREELLGTKHNIIRHPSMQSELYKDMWEKITNNETWVGEIKNQKKDGTSYWVLSTISPRYDKQGNKIGYTSIRQDITNQKIVEELSITDGLTNIYNRRHFNDLSVKLLHSAQRDNDLFCFLLLDIDYFKLYNDNYGHQMGDDVLIKFAKALQNSLKRASDYPFRLGGEEFGIIFSAQTPAKALEFAQIVQESIAAMQIPHAFSSVAKHITASLGLFCKHADQIASIDALYKETDDLLYKAKESGRNQIVTNINT
jgi:diguanylate cyclase (GGDEF)-like protein/PAS domain S-box-containing protein